MNKILIIGQAPPAVKQEVPYDTTMLYEMLSWVGITKEQAQEMFEFEAMVENFPGHGDNGHKLPALKDIIQHYNKTLQPKLQSAKRVICLGRVSENFFMNTTYEILYPEIKWLALIHPSKRNYRRIMSQKEAITLVLQRFLTHNHCTSSTRSF